MEDSSSPLHRDQTPVLVLLDWSAGSAGEGGLSPAALLAVARRYGALAQVRVYAGRPDSVPAGAVAQLHAAGMAVMLTPSPAVQMAVDALQCARPDSVVVLVASWLSVVPLVPALAGRGVTVILASPDTLPEGGLLPAGLHAVVPWREIIESVPEVRAPATSTPPAINGAAPAPTWPAFGWQPPSDSSHTRTLERHIRDLQQVLEQAGEPPSGALDDAACRIEAGVLRDLTEDIDGRWGELPADQQRALLGMCAARIKHLQGQNVVAADDDLSSRLTRTFGILTRFSKEYMPGAVHGLARVHQPRHDSWASDAHEYYSSLCKQAGMVTDPDAVRARLLAELAEAVAMWSAALPEERTVPSAEVAERVRACFRSGMGRTDAEIVRIVAPAARELRATDFKSLREAVKQLERAPAPQAPEADGAMPVCSHPDCVRLAGARSTPGTAMVEVEPGECEVCENSNDRRAMLLMADTLHRNNLERLLVVGGSPAKRTLLEQTLGDEGLQLRCVDGTGHSNTREAVNNLNWCQVAVIWGGTELDHKTSDLYTDNLPPHVLAVTLARRGIEALCREVIARAEG